MRGVQIIGPQRAQFLASQPGVVGKGEHHPIPDGFEACHIQDGLPLVIIWNPGELGVARDESFLTLPPKAFASRVAPTANGVDRAVPLLDEVVVEEPDDGQTLLERRIGKACSRVEDTNGGAARIGPGREVMYILSNVLFGCCPTLIFWSWQNTR